MAGRSGVDVVRIDERYELIRCLGGSAAVRHWFATDLRLGRNVFVTAAATGSSRGREVLAAARRLSVLGDPRLPRVDDALDVDGTTYVVTEWVAEPSLRDLLRAGRMTPELAVDLVSEALEALGAAAKHGVRHVHLSLDSIRCGASGLVKLVGTGLDAAADPASARRSDVADLARLLLEALNGCAKPPKPSLCRVLDRAWRSDPALRSPDQLATALAPHRTASTLLRPLTVRPASGHESLRTARRTVRELMTTDIVTVSEDTPVSQMAALLEGANCSAVPVVDAAGKVTGVITAADLAWLRVPATV